jgi:hypothetical protein
MSAVRMEFPRVGSRAPGTTLPRGGGLCHETMFRHCLFTCMVSTDGFRKNSIMVLKYQFSVDLGTSCPMLDFFPKSSMTL